jgi:hypothetical protein
MTAAAWRGTTPSGRTSVIEARPLVGAEPMLVAKREYWGKDPNSAAEPGTKWVGLEATVSFQAGVPAALATVGRPAPALRAARAPISATLRSEKKRVAIPCVLIFNVSLLFIA